MDDILATTIKVAGYGQEIAGVLTNHAISARKIPKGFEGTINLLNATVSTLQQVSSHLCTEIAASPRHEKCKCVLSQEGLGYIQLLAEECATTFVKIPLIMADACLDSKELKAKRKLEKKSVAKKHDPILAIQLDRTALTESIENLDWELVGDALEDVMEKLHEIQLHLLLVHQVVSLGELSWIVFPSHVDIKSVVGFHMRIQRTADLIGIKSPGHMNKVSGSRRDSSSDSDSISSWSDSDSDTNTDRSNDQTKKYKKTFYKSPPLRAPPGRHGPAAPSSPPPPPPRWVPQVATKPTRSEPCPTRVTHNPSPDAIKPPAYSEDHKAETLGVPSNSRSSTVGAILDGSVKTSTVVSNRCTTIHTPEKDASLGLEAKNGYTSTSPELGTFKAKSHGLAFKIKSMFRGKQSLAEEMKKSLSGSESHLRAFVLRGHETRQVPHSAFHTLEATHMRTILAQLHDNTWYNTFTTLNQVEHQNLERLVRPFLMGKFHERELVVLKVLEGNKPSAWMMLSRDQLNKSSPAPRGSNDRVILAILREKLLDGKPLPPIASIPGGGMAPPPPPPPGFGCPPGGPTIRPPPTLLNHHLLSRISDLSTPPPPLPVPSSMPFHPIRRGPPGPPVLGARSASDKRPLTDYAAMMALTSYTEFTLRLADPLNPSFPRTWSRVVITPESAEHHVLLRRVQAFHQRGGDIIEKKLRLNDDQNKQLMRLMDELQAFERDAARFEWCWAEISLYNDTGEIKLGSQATSATATTIHLIAKRMPKASCKPTDLYNSLMEPPPLPRPQPPPPVVIVGPPSRRRKTSKNCRSQSISDSSGSDSDSSRRDSDNERGIRLSLRKDRARKMKRRKIKRERIVNSDSDSDTSGSESEEDVIQVKLDLKKGDDVVQALLDLWTSQGEARDKGKLAACTSSNSSSG